MKVRELARSAFVEIRAHKARSALTCVSLAIGVAASLYTFAEVRMITRRFHNALGLAGPGRITVKAKENYVSRGLSPGLTWDDAKAIRAEMPELNMVYPRAVGWGSDLRLGSALVKQIAVIATTDEWTKRDWVYTQRGRFLSKWDVDHAARVCVLIQQGGWKTKPWWAKYFRDEELTKLMKHQDLLNRQVQIDDHVFTVVGILKEPLRENDPRWFHEGFGNAGTALVPISTYQAYLNKRDPKEAKKLRNLEVDTGDERTIGIYLHRIKGLLAARHRGEPDVDIKDFREMITGALAEMRSYVVAIMIIGVIAVLAGGIGIMNVTLATIFSRIKEIGIRRALGATRGDIVWQFVAEAAGLGAISGAIGLGLGILAILYLSPEEGRRELHVEPLHALVALAISLGTAFLFALFPAYRASRFDPVEALHYE